MSARDLEAVDNNQETFNEWLAQDFILDELERTDNMNDRLVNLYDYLKLYQEYESELEEM